MADSTATSAIDICFSTAYHMSSEQGDARAHLEKEFLMPANGELGSPSSLGPYRMFLQDRYYDI